MKKFFGTKKGFTVLTVLTVLASVALWHFGVVPAAAASALPFIPIAFGTTYTTFTTGTGAMKPHLGEQKMFWIENELDFTGKTIVAADIYEALKVKAGWRVLKTNVLVVTAAAGDALTANIGDGDGADSYDGAIDLKGTAGTEYESVIGTDAYAAGGNGKLYTADDTIDLAFPTVTNVTTNPKVKVRALVQAIN